MPWWFWVLLWGTLTIGSLAFLAWFVYRALTRGFMLLDLVATWMESVETRFDEAQANTRRKLPDEQSLGIFTPVTTAYNEYEQGKQTRRSERIKRRVSRRDRLGQPQNIGPALSTERFIPYGSVVQSPGNYYRSHPPHRSALRCSQAPRYGT